ncbi:unnamed protein product, partial [Ectocarpus fasciculatus]
MFHGLPCDFLALRQFLLRRQQTLMQLRDLQVGHGAGHEVLMNRPSVFRSHLAAPPGAKFGIIESRTQPPEEVSYILGQRLVPNGFNAGLAARLLVDVHTMREVHESAIG